MQIPSGIPHPDDNTPLDFNNPADIIIYILLPLMAFGFVMLWKWQRKRQ